LIFFTYQHL